MGVKRPQRVIGNQIDHCPAGELERARALWLRRFGQTPQSPEERAKQMRFLAGRGFSGDVIRRVIKDGIPDPST